MRFCHILSSKTIKQATVSRTYRTRIHSTTQKSLPEAPDAWSGRFGKAFKTALNRGQMSSKKPSRRKTWGLFSDSRDFERDSNARSEGKRKPPASGWWFFRQTRYHGTAWVFNISRIRSQVFSSMFRLSTGIRLPGSFGARSIRKASAMAIASLR